MLIRSSHLPFSYICILRAVMNQSGLGAIILTTVTYGAFFDAFICIVLSPGVKRGPPSSALWLNMLPVMV